jgi:CMD domain protein
MSAAPPDVIDLLAGIQPGSPLDQIRAQRAQARENAQQSYLALFQPAADADMRLQERHALAVFVAALHRQPEIAAFYAVGLAASGQAGSGESKGIGAHLDAEIGRSAARGPYGRFPAGPLSAEDSAGPSFTVLEENRRGLGARLAAALEHAHMLVFHPRDSAPPYLQALLDAGWSTTGIVVISQLVAFLSYQIRVVAGLRVLNARPA